MPVHGVWVIHARGYESRHLISFWPVPEEMGTADAALRHWDKLDYKHSSKLLSYEL